MHCLFIHLFINLENLFLHQSQPSGTPSLVKPVLDKINVEGLKRDLNKFREHYLEQVFSFWSEWVNNIDDLAAVPETWEWPLDALLAAEKVKPYNAVYSVPEHLQTLQDKERQPTKQASWDGLDK